MKSGIMETNYVLNPNYRNNFLDIQIRLVCPDIQKTDSAVCDNF